MSYDPRSSVSLRDMMDRLFSEAFVMPRERSGAQAPQTSQAPEAALTLPVNMYETDADVVVVMPLPGVSPNDIQIDLLGSTLTVRTEVRRDEAHPEAGPAGGASGPGTRPHRYLRHEFQIGPYARTIELPYPVDADKVMTSYEHGLLTLRFPRPSAKAPRRITLSGS
jgi:HSP20 family protein